jgi:hypothetical protein
MNAKQVHDKIISTGVRIFKISIHEPYSRDPVFWVHWNKTTAEWRKDIKAFLDSDKNLSTNSLSKDEDGCVIGGHADDKVCCNLNVYLTSLGYFELDDVISDVFECRITNELARLIDDPIHEEQKDGFGHYGWESKK